MTRFYRSIAGSGLLLLVLTSLATAQINDNIANAVAISSLPFADTLSNVDATQEPGEPLSTCGTDGLNSIWWKYTATSSGKLKVDTYGSDFDTILMVYFVSGGLVPVGCNDDFGGSSQSQIVFTANNGNTYYFRVIGYNGEEGNVHFNLQVPTPDILDGAVTIPSLPYSDTLSNVGAGSETSEVAASCGTDGGNSVWWKYTASFSGSMVVDTDSSDFDTILSVHTGGTHPLTEVACDDDGGTTSGQSKVGFNVMNGFTYYFRVVGSGGADGLVHFHAKTILGDNLADAIVIDGLPYADTLSNADAALETDEALASCGSDGGNSIWWRFTPSFSDTMVVDTDSSGFDTILSVFKGSEHPLSELACDDDGGVPTGRSRVALEVEQDSTYLLRVSGFGGASGSAILHVSSPGFMEAVVNYNGKVLLEGAYSSGGMMSVPGGFSASVPLQQPYSDASYDGTILDYDGSDSTMALPAGTIDWLLISLRRGTDASTEVVGSEKAVIVLEDGSIVASDGGVVALSANPDSMYYVVLRHRNHLSVMSSSPISFSPTGEWDFTTAGQAYTTGPPAEKDLGGGYYGMFAADPDHDGQATTSDFNLWLPSTKLDETGYLDTDFDIDGQVTTSDFNLWLPNTKLAVMSQVPE